MAGKKRKDGDVEAEVLDDASAFADDLRTTMRKDFKDVDVVVDPEDPIVQVKAWVTIGKPLSDLTDAPGAPLGNITVFQGLEDCGKTTALMHLLVAAQQQGVVTVLVETERKFNLKRFVEFGGDPRKLIIFMVDTIEDGFEKVHKVIDRIQERAPEKPVLIGWDSLGMTPTEAELKAGARGDSMMSAARVIKRNLRIIVSKLKDTKVGLIFVNHIYTKPGIMFGNSTAGYGGNGVYFAAVLVFEFKKIGTGHKIRDGQRIFDHLKVQIRCKKNHISDAQDRRIEARIGVDGIGPEEPRKGAAGGGRGRAAPAADEQFESRPELEDGFGADADDL